MAKIWYSVQGDGMGHAIRSAPIIAELKKNHTLYITACNKAYPYLKKRYGRAVHKIEGTGFVYEQNEVKKAKSITKFFKLFPENSRKNIRNVLGFVTKFRPDVIISDFEPVANYSGFFLGIPVINLDNISILAQAKIHVPEHYRMLWLESLSLIRFFHPRSAYHLIPAITQKQTYRNAELFPPVLRPEIMSKKPLQKDFILVYQTTPTNDALVHVLNQIDERFIFYGMNRNGKNMNVVFRNFDEKRFIDDLRSCKGVIINGGFTTLGEALYFKKPVLVIPIKNQFEQIFNGITVKEEGYGDFSETLSRHKVEHFIKMLPTYKKRLSSLDAWDNSAIIARIEGLIAEHASWRKPLLYGLERKRPERTLTIIKPDAVQKRLIGEVIRRLEAKGIRPVAMKMARIPRLKALFFYRHLRDRLPRPVFNSVVDYMSENKVVAIAWEGKGVVSKVRKLCGPTNPKDAAKTQIRSLSDDDLVRKFRHGLAVKNIIHSSATKDEAKREIAYFFWPWELRS